jgi:hypothetical protein
MSQRPTIGVVIPTLNCATLLEEHLDAMELWLDAVLGNYANGCYLHSDKGDNY